MPSVNKTPNIGLNQWEGNEYPKRTDFNEDNLKTDQAIQAIHTEKAQPNGIATLGADGKVPSTQLPVIEVPVTSVNQKTGAVVLTASDVGAAPAVHGHTISNITGLQSALDGKETPTGAQQKVDAVQSNLDAHMAEKASESNLGHMKVDGTSLVSNDGIVSVRDYHTYLYVEGKELTATGGFAKIYSNGTYSVFEKYEDYMLIRAFAPTTFPKTLVSTNYAINLSNIKILYVEFETISGNQYGGNFTFKVSNAKNASDPDVVSESTISGTNLKIGEKTVLSLDVSSLSGSYYIHLESEVNGSVTNLDCAHKIYKIWGEK